jgi:hypothetical protein
MLTRPIDKALDALIACRQNLPFLRDLYRPESPEWAALNGVLNAVGQASEALIGRSAQPDRSGGPGRV